MRRCRGISDPQFCLDVCSMLMGILDVFRVVDSKTHFDDVVLYLFMLWLSSYGKNE